jgi:heme/copper-type cytochrome/quinol oxidase subunit 4
MSDPETESKEVKGRMLPGIAGICIFMILMTTANVYAALAGVYGRGVAKYAILTLCTLLATGIFGLLRLAKWGWALVTAGCLLLAAGYFYAYARTTHIGFFLVQGLFSLLFFLYLSRPETRERLR